MPVDRRSPGSTGRQLVSGGPALILNNSRVSRHTVVENTILEKNVIVQEGATVGLNKEHDRARGLVVSSGGLTVVGQGQVVPP